MNATFADFGIDLAGRHGAEVKTTCPKCSATRKKKTYPCLNVNTEKGIWHCWHCGWRGGLNGEDHAGRSQFFSVKKGGEPSAVYTYRGADGSAAFFVCRYELAHGAKEFSQCRPNGASGVEWKAAPAPRPLYRLPEIVADTARPVLVVEGEKCADAAAKMLPDYAVTTWAGGAKATKGVDLDPLRGRRVALWPDADEPGREAAGALAKRLHGIAREVLVLDVDDRHEGWDIADAVAEGWTADDLATFVEEHAASARVDPAPPEAKKANPAGAPFGARTAREITNTAEGATASCVPDRVPCGLVIIGAKPKARKSWWALQLDIAKATGRPFMGKQAECCRTLGLYLEDNDPRMKRRLAFFGLTPETAPENLHLAYTWAQGADGVEQLDRWMQRYPDTGKITIDVLQRFRGPKDPKQSVYEADYYIMGLLHALTVKYPGLTIVVVHHVRKGSADDPVEMLNGTFGIAGAADHYIILRRHEKERWIAYTDGRDWEDWDHEFLWEFRPGEGWVQLGIFDGAGLTDQQAQIVAMAKQAGYVTPTAIAERFKVTRPTAHEALAGLVKKDVLYNKSGRYHLTNITVP